MRKKMYIVLAVAMILLTAGCSNKAEETPPSEQSMESSTSESESGQSTPSPESTSSSEAEAEVIEKVTMAAVGDNLIHDVIWNQAAARAGGAGYNFVPLYDHVASLISGADIAVLNQETPIVSSREPSNYPLFNSPPELARDIAAVGFDVATIANNHMLDQSAQGLAETIKLLRSTEGLTVAGAYLDASEHENIPTVTVRGVKFAFLAYTESTNGIPLPQENAGMIIYAADRENIEKQVRLAKEQADFVIVSVHWGNEGSIKPTDAQRALAESLAEWGADVVLGHHPHAIQPMEKIGETAVYYSLGNFVSAQIEPVNMVGAMARLSFEKNMTTGEKSITEAGVTPLVTDYGTWFSGLTVYTLKEYTKEIAAAHGIISTFGEEFSLGYIHELVTTVFGEETLNEALA